MPTFEILSGCKNLKIKNSVLIIKKTHQLESFNGEKERLLQLNCFLKKNGIIYYFIQRLHFSHFVLYSVVYQAYIGSYFPN